MDAILCWQKTTLGKWGTDSVRIVVAKETARVIWTWAWSSKRLHDPVRFFIFFLHKSLKDANPLRNEMRLAWQYILAPVFEPVSICQLILKPVLLSAIFLSGFAINSTYGLNRTECEACSNDLHCHSDTCWDGKCVEGTVKEREKCFIWRMLILYIKWWKYYAPVQKSMPV